MPSDGGQSTSTRSNRCGQDRLQRRGDPLQVVICARQLNIRPAQIHFAGDDLQALEGGLLNFVQQAALAQQRMIGAGALDLLHADAAGRIGLRVEVEQQHPPADGGDTGRQVDGGGGFAHAAFLVGNSNDFGWHAAGVMKPARRIQVFAPANQIASPVAQYFRWILLPAGCILWA